MNTGIGDAINLGWKLAHVLQGRAANSLLETFEAERIGFARALVHTTDRAFDVVINSGPLGFLGRRYLIPGMITLAAKTKIGQHAFFTALSQTEIEYEHSEISAGHKGQLRGGDRLPWIDDGTDNFAPLSSLDWQVHVYGTAAAELQATCLDLDLPLHTFPWTQAAEKAGFKKDLALLIRPDSYIGLVLPDTDSTQKLIAYCEEFKLRFAN
jgi:hypothetical protein